MVDHRYYYQLVRDRHSEPSVQRLLAILSQVTGSRRGIRQQLHDMAELCDQPGGRPHWTVRSGSPCGDEVSREKGDLGNWCGHHYSVAVRVHADQDPGAERRRVGVHYCGIVGLFSNRSRSHADFHFTETSTMEQYTRIRPKSSPPPTELRDMPSV